jgi:aminocarboxymuconate-semialdehyde decarboxylase
MMPVIDVHSHMLSHAYLALLLDRGAPQYTLRKTASGPGLVLENGTPLLPMTDAMFDYAARIAGMDAAGVDMAIVSLTAPNAFFGDAETSAKAATLINDDMRVAQIAYPDRIRFFATLPWEYPDLAVRELARACDLGAAGVVVIANIQGKPLTDPHFGPVWKAIDDRALPVFVHPTNPPGYREMQLDKYMLHASVAFLFDTTLAITRMVMDGFFDRFAKLKIITSHGGGTIPFVAPRVEAMYERFAPAREAIKTSPMHYFKQIYYDSAVFDVTTLRAVVDFAGASHVMYGTDFPHGSADLPANLVRIDALPPDQAKAVKGGNAQALFGL